ncbi:Nif3-like dinuclear metal center hexameric protein, partial [bacterium]|nr:Nif3-like dinuclear metal center hexameric protein [bacterium]
KLKSDLIITHHGLLWNKDDRRIQGPFREKIQLLLANGIAAAAYHLPLDFHSEIGNNVQLAKKLGLTDLEEFSQTGTYAEAIMGKTEETTIDTFSIVVEKALRRKPTVFPFGNDKIRKIAIITGAAQDFFTKAVDNGADCFLTGEVSEKNYSMSKEYHVHFISAGHYATEKFGIQKLGEKLETEFDVRCEFIDIPNPV